MDAETLAAVRWAGDELPAGSRIAAERVSSILLASQAGLWPVRKTMRRRCMRRACTSPTNGVPRSLNSPAACSYSTSMSIGGWPRNYHTVGAYFYKGETEGPQQLTQAELTKFDNVRGSAKSTGTGRFPSTI